MQGPKIRVGKFANGKTTLANGSRSFWMPNAALGDDGRVGLDYKELPGDVEPGAVLLLDDGRIVLVVEKVIVARSTPR